MQKFFTKFQKLFIWISRLLAFLSFSAAALIKAQTVTTWVVFGFDVIAWLRGAGWWLLPLILFLQPIIEFLRRNANRISLYPLLEDQIEDLRSKLFPQDDPVHYHRITLFKHVSFAMKLGAWWPPRKGWLIAKFRTGYVTQNSRSYFRAPNNPELAEGIAGLTYVNGQHCIVEDLPDLAKNDADKKIEEYAKKSNASVEYIKKNLPKSRSLCGIPLFVNDRACWGVLVIDSRNSKLPVDAIRNETSHFVKSISSLIGRLE